MTKPWDISAHDLSVWADRIDAAAMLPKLVRRLLFATAPLRMIEMRADEGTRLRGWDGIVQARESTKYCPAGLSVWEMSVDQDIKRKLDRDFEKRTSTPPPPVRPKETTYVAITPRRFPGKQRWIKEKQALRRWAHVRVLDVDDLSGWLDQAPAVARWFAGLLGRPDTAVRDPEELLSAWSERTRPPLPAELVLAGQERQRQAGQLLEWLTRPPSRPLALRGESREEALLFAAAVLKSSTDPQAWLSRTLIVESAEALSWGLSVQAAEPPILLVAFDGADPGRLANAGAHVVLAQDRQSTALPGATLDLEPIPWKPMEKELVQAGLRDVEAERLVRDAGGSIGKLQALCGYVPLPDWARGLPQPELIALLLAGAWTPRNEADREALRRLGGQPELVEQLCVELSRRGDIERVDEGWGPGVWQWKSPREVWTKLGDRLTDTNREDFQAVVLDVLGALDPVYDLPIETRLYTPVTRLMPPHSSALRSGLARSMVMLSLGDAQPRTAQQRSKGSRYVATLVSRLLLRKEGWKAWASLAELLPTLAEAAPEAFLEAVEQSLVSGTEGVAQLLAEEGGSFGATPHVHLLWALEALGWSPEPLMMTRVAIALARLAVHDEAHWGPGKVVNRPIGSLTMLLDEIHPQSRSSPEDRLRVLELLLDDPGLGSVAWSVGVGMLREPAGMFMPSHTPSYRWEPVDPLRRATADDQLQQRNGALELLLDRADADVPRWIALVDPMLAMPPRVAREILDALLRARSGITQPALDLWSRLRRLCRDAHQHSDRVHAETTRRLRTLYDAFTPDDPVQKYAWLFGIALASLPEPPEGGWEQEESQKSSLRRQALADLWHLPDRWDKLVALSRTAEAPHRIGGELTRTAFADEVEQQLLREVPAGLHEQVVPEFFGQRFRSMDAPDRIHWIERVLRRFIDRDHLDAAVHIARALPRCAETWDLVERFGEPLKSMYWKTVGSLYDDHPPADWERAVGELLNAGRLVAALETVNQAKDRISAATALRVLERLNERPPSDRPKESDSSLSHLVENILTRLESEPGIDAAEVTRLELALLPVLENRARLHRILTASLADSPESFLQVLRVAASRGPGADSEEEATRAYLASEVAGLLLSSWHGWPGAGLPDAEREQHLFTWATAVLDAATAEGWGGPAASHVGVVLARAPDGPDGLWPCLAARRLLRQNRYPVLASGLFSGRLNLRGVTTRELGEDGQQERAIAASYEEAARQMQDEYPETAALLDRLARHHQEEAEDWDAQARRERIEHGESEEPAAIPAAPTAPLDAPAAPLSRLQVRGVGPAPEMTIDLAPRLNLLTGDNSLGKTLVLDILWWCLTGAFAQPDRIPRPTVRVRNGKILKNRASIAATADGRTVSGTYSGLHERWTFASGGALASGLAIYARIDGGFSVWDPVRNVTPASRGEIDLSSGYHFTQREVWEGLYPENSKKPLCSGLITDAVRWRSERPRAYDLLEKALGTLSPPGERLRFGVPRRFSVREDARDYPVLLFPYGPVFAVHASWAVQRLLGLAYALVWAITEINEAAQVAGRGPVDFVTMLIDEVEAHLHPKWQRTVLRALLAIIEEIAPQAKVQLVVTTHAPLVLASIEQLFSPDTDALFDFDLETVPSADGDGRRIPVVEKEPWRVRGDVSAWLASEIFDHTSPRSPEADEAIHAAKAALEDPSTDRKKARKVHRLLQRTLSELDPFWIRWRFMAEKRGWIEP